MIFDDGNRCTSMQPLGDARVLVEFERSGPRAIVCGAWVMGELVDETHFAPAVLEGWKQAIEREIERDAIDLAEMAE